jgi:hypothetical protein
MRDEKKFSPPFIKVPAVVVDTTQLDVGHRAVYLAIKAHQNAKTGRCDPSNRTIAKESGLSLATVKRRKAELIKKGILNIQRGHQSSVQYSFPLETEDPAKTLTLMRNLKRKQGPSLLGDWIERVEGDLLGSPVTLINKDRGFIRATREPSLGSPVSHKQEEVTTHGGADPFMGKAAAAVGESKEVKKEKPIERIDQELLKIAEIEAEKKRKRLEREAKAEANKPEIEKILADYRARKAEEKKGE